MRSKSVAIFNTPTHSTHPSPGPKSEVDNSFLIQCDCFRKADLKGSLVSEERMITFETFNWFY